MPHHTAACDDLLMGYRDKISANCEQGGWWPHFRGDLLILARPIMSEPSLISEEYRKMQQQLHENPKYGVASVQYAPLVAQVIESVGAHEMLDYGAGKGRLGITLKEHLKRPLSIRHYDPAIPAWSARPEPCDFVACIDVLEHIEPPLLDHVLDDLQAGNRPHRHVYGAYRRR